MHQIAENVREFPDRGAGPHSAAPTAGILRRRRSHFATCLCGRCVEQPVRGRRRVTCSEACRLRRDSLTRKLRRRREWLQLWRSVAAAGGCSRNQVRRELAALQRDISAFERALAGREKR